MNMENPEIEQMKADFEALKEEFGKLKIVNDELIRATIKSKFGILNKARTQEYAFALIALVLCPTFRFSFGASWYFVGGTALLMLLCMYVNWRIYRDVGDSALESGDLLSAARSVRNLKLAYHKWIRAGIVIILLWGSWLAYEIIQHSQNDKMALGMMIAALTGLVIGGIIGLCIDRRVIRTCDEIIRQIEQ